MLTAGFALVQAPGPTVTWTVAPLLLTAVGVIVIPPQFVEEIVHQDEVTETREDFERLQMKAGKYRARDIYPLKPDLEKLFQDWLKKRQTH